MWADSEPMYSVPNNIETFQNGQVDELLQKIPVL